MDKDFFQTGPHLENTFDSDPLLKKWILDSIDLKFQPEILRQLSSCGKKASTTWLNLANEAEANPPQHTPFNQWGRRIDELKISRAWSELENEVAREGIIATAYEKKYGPTSRAVQLALLYLFHPSSAFVSCPLAMTDGAAKCLNLLGSEQLKKRILPHLLSRDPNEFWTSGQWMTEKTGGSDVSGTSTFAKSSEGHYLLSGTKWFTSATNSQVSMLLAKTESASSLSLFFVETKDANNCLKPNIEILRLKDKLGTRAMPTAELVLKDLPGVLLGLEGQGVKNITTILNITRVYNSVCATSHLRRGIDLLKSYSDSRIAFGKKIGDHSLHQDLMNYLELCWKKCFLFTFRIGLLLGKEEANSITDMERAELRCMTPVLKLYTAKMCMLGTSEVCEGFGGVGYIEDSGIPRLLRDAQVFSIWEGTSNVLALDFVRALNKEPGALDWFNRLLDNKTTTSDLIFDINNPEKNLRNNIYIIAEKYINTLV